MTLVKTSKLILEVVKLGSGKARLGLIVSVSKGKKFDDMSKGVLCNGVINIFYHYLFLTYLYFIITVDDSTKEKWLISNEGL
jgi:hypothetical protein